MFDKYYVLEGQEIKPTSLKGYVNWMGTDPERHIGSTDVGGYWVSTVFLAIDHQFGDGPPLLFETMVFAKDPTTGKVDFMDLYCDRCSTYEEAVAMHDKAVDKTYRVFIGEEDWSNDE